MPREELFDARQLEPPEPLFQTLEKLEQMEPGEFLRLLIHREPMMLYPQLQEMKIPWEVIDFGHPHWTILIGPIPERHG